ncbi:MAG TPA: DUF3043 domain-containing protein [Mycobacteriales bacterium]|nr:DUF3043 domain-containing protein [Mycobacteriales bacterium]
MASKSSSSAEDAATPKPGGKGRPTPKRNAGRPARAHTPAPKTRKESIKRQREEVKAARRAQRTALRSGDDRNLPAFARGPERAAVRDAVDSRASLGWIALPGLALNAASFVVPGGTARDVLAQAGFFAFVALIIDMLSSVRRVKRLLSARFPDGTEIPRRQLYRSAIARNTQLRRTRVPRPRVSVGEDVFATSNQER